MTGDSNQLFEQLKDTVIASMEEHRVPGVAVGVLHKGETYTAGFGVTNIEHPLDVTDTTLFQIGSITKTFTATVIMRLVEQGKLDLDAPVRTYLPDFKVADETVSQQATLRHLLTHTGGWAGDVFGIPGAEDDNLVDYVANLASVEQLAPLGTHYSYNNAGFAVAGRIIEVVTGKPFHIALSELLLEPLGLDHCYLDPSDVMTRRFAAGHDEGADGVEVARPWFIGKAGCSMGGLACDVHMMLRYAQFHLGDGTVADGTRLLTTESLHAMQSPQMKIWDNNSIGLSWHIKDMGGLCTFGHGGGTNGQISMLTLVPEHNFALITVTNAEKGGAVVDEVEHYALESYFGAVIERPEPIESTEDELRAFAGRYVRPFAELELGLLAGQLVGQLRFPRGFLTPEPPPPPPPMTFVRCGENRLLCTNGPGKDSPVDVIRNPDGSIGWLRASLRLHKRVE